jgi:hypothetical protein
MPTFDARRFVHFFGPPVLILSSAAHALAGCNDEAVSGDASGPAKGPAEATAALEAHPLDTAILWPLPETRAADALLRADASGKKGALVPAYAWNTLPALSAEKNATLYPKLRLVSANIDPCFPSGVEGKVDDKGVSQCRKQLRLIFQPVVDDGSGKLTTEDVTVHTFYEMDQAVFTEMTQSIVRARGASSLGDEAIDIHPLMKAEGGSGPYAKALAQIFLDHAGAENLVKVTFLGLRGAGVGWQMGGVDFVGTKSTDMTVPETKVTREELINAGTAGDFDATVDPRTKFSDALSVLLKSGSARAASSDDVRKAYAEALRIDNPETELHPGTVDCASCHLATPLRLWVERNKGLKASDFPEDYRHARWNLENRSQTKDNTQSFRCFGYYGRDVSISQRTINEAAAVADFLNAKILRGGK